jgi:hypothetical protein
MVSPVVLAALVAVSTVGQTLSEESIDKQNEAFQQWWGTDFVWKFDELPDKGVVAKHRLPYSGYIYPDTAGGTGRILQKYDRAFNGRYSATAHERWDTTAYGERTYVGGGFGFFGGGGRYVTRTPHWHGHCNGWAAATIRHAQPERNVVRNGVTFTPADIKGLLAELYIYNEMNVLAGSDEYMSAPLFHTIITNWIGRGSHPIAMEADPGKEKWNYPVYSYATSHAKYNNQVQVRMNIAYAKDSQGEFQRSPLYKWTKYFHYYLNLDAEGKIVNGGYYRDSSRIDMLWIPLRPKASGKPGNERGNPHIDVDTILAIWRDSVPSESRKQWLVIDQPEADRVQEIPEGLAHLVPLQEFPEPVVEEAQAPEAPAEDAVAAATVEETAEPDTETVAAEESTSAGDASATATESSEVPEETEATAESSEEPAAETTVDTERAVEGTTESAGE